MGTEAQNTNPARRFRVAAVCAALGALVVASVAMVWVSRSANAADHLDPPARTNVGANSDVAADIADVYFWNTSTTVIIAVTGAGPQAAGVGPIFDRDVIHRVHLSNDGNPTTDEFVIDVRHGRDASNRWGVQFLGIPGSSGPVEGPVQTTLTDGATIKAVSGLFDDPFFFDLVGFNETRATGTLSLRNDRNFFGGKNDTSFVIEFPRAAVENGAFPLTAWAEARRISGP